MPPLLYDIMRVLLLLTGPAAFLCLLNAGIALRREGGTVFWVGGGFSKWMLWAVIFLGLGTHAHLVSVLWCPSLLPAWACDWDAVACRASNRILRPS